MKLAYTHHSFEPLLNRGIVIFLFIFSYNPSFSQQLPECNVSELLASQRQNLGNDPRTVLPSGTSFINPYFVGDRPAESLDEGEGMAARDRVTSEQQIRSTFENIRQMTAQEILRSSSSTPEEKNILLQRLQRLQITFSDSCPPLAANNSLTQTVVVCRRALRLPSLAIVALLAHEVGHTIDLCSLTGTFYTRREPLRQLATHLRRRSLSTDEQSFVNQLDQNPGAQSLIAARNIPGSEPVLAELVRRGAISPADSGMPLARNPVSATYVCLSQNGYPRSPSSAEEACNSTQYTEPSAQVWSARITAAYIRQNPPATRLDALGLFAAADLSSLIAKGPSNKVRDFDNIFLSEPSIRQAFGCRPRANQNCMTRFNPTQTDPRPTNIEPTIIGY